MLKKIIFSLFYLIEIDLTLDFTRKSNLFSVLKWLNVTFREICSCGQFKYRKQDKPVEPKFWNCFQGLTKELWTIKYFHIIFQICHHFQFKILIVLTMYFSKTAKHFIDDFMLIEP